MEINNNLKLKLKIMNFINKKNINLINKNYNKNQLLFYKIVICINKTCKIINL